MDSSKHINNPSQVKSNIASQNPQSNEDDLKLEKFLEDYLYTHSKFSSFSNGIMSLSVPEKEQLLFGQLQEPPQTFNRFQQRAFIPILVNLKFYGPIFEQLLGNDNFKDCEEPVKKLWYDIVNINDAVQHEALFDKLCEKYQFSGQCKESLKQLFSLVKKNIKDAESNPLVAQIKELFGLLKQPQYQKKAAKCLAIFLVGERIAKFTGIYNKMTSKFKDPQLKYLITGYISPSELSDMAGIDKTLLQTSKLTEEQIDDLQDEFDELELENLKTPFQTNQVKNLMNNFVIYGNLLFTYYSFTVITELSSKLQNFLQNIEPQNAIKLDKIQNELKILQKECEECQQDFCYEKLIAYKLHLSEVLEQLMKIIEEFEGQIAMLELHRNELVLNGIYGGGNSAASLYISYADEDLSSAQRVVGIAGGIIGIVNAFFSFKQSYSYQKAINMVKKEMRRANKYKKELRVRDTMLSKDIKAQKSNCILGDTSYQNN